MGTQEMVRQIHSGPRRNTWGNWYVSRGFGCWTVTYLPTMIVYGMFENRSAAVTDAQGRTQ